MTRRSRIAAASAALLVAAFAFQLIRTIRAEHAFAERVEQVRSLAAQIAPAPELEHTRAELFATLTALDARLETEASGEALARALGEDAQRAAAQARLDAAQPLLEEMRAFLGGTQCQRLLAQHELPPAKAVERYTTARDWTHLLAARASRERDDAQQAAWLGAAFDQAQLRDDGTFLGANLGATLVRDLLVVLQSQLDDPASDPALLHGELDARLERVARPCDFRRVAAVEAQRLLPVLERMRDARAGFSATGWLARPTQLEDAARELSLYDELSRTGVLAPAATDSTHQALTRTMEFLQAVRLESETARADLARRASAR